MLLMNLKKNGFISPPAFVDESTTAFLAITGSTSYGVSQPGSSDFDVAGFVLPSKEDVFPHLRGEILGFGKTVDRFETWSMHHVKANN